MCLCMSLPHTYMQTESTVHRAALCRCYHHALTRENTQCLLYFWHIAKLSSSNTFLIGTESLFHSYLRHCHISFFDFSHHIRLLICVCVPVCLCACECDILSYMPYNQIRQCVDENPLNIRLSLSVVPNEKNHEMRNGPVLQSHKHSV